LADHLLYLRAMVRWIFGICFMTILVSCGKQDFPDYQDEAVALEHEEVEATYHARFQNLNGSKVRAQGFLWVKGRQFYVKVVVKNSSPFIRHQQFIHSREKCPKGRIDYQEVESQVGEILIPLDRHIQSQEKGMEWFPVANKDGEYYYSRATALPFLIHDLYQKDLKPHDGITKLPQDEKLELDRRTIMLYGSATNPLEPVACAEIFFESYIQ
jgi:hypothetical protein